MQHSQLRCHGESTYSQVTTTIIIEDRRRRSEQEKVLQIFGGIGLLPPDKGG